MDDDHVDRPGVEAQQCVQLTGTNSSIGLNALITRCPCVRCRRDSAWAKSYKTLAKPVSSASFGWVHAPKKFASFSPFAGLVTFAERSDPIPSRTRPSNAFAPMVLCLKTWESRPLPGLRRAESSSFRCLHESASRSHGIMRSKRNRSISISWSMSLSKKSVNF